MRRLFIIVLACLLIVPVLIARDGHYWKGLDRSKDAWELAAELSELAKMNYLHGMLDGLVFLSDSTNKLVEVLYETALSNEKNIRLYIDMLDDFYGDYANLNIDILDALIFCLFRVKGIHDDDVAKEELRILRRIYGDTEAMLSLRKKEVRDEKFYECIRVIDGDTIVVKQIEHEPYRLVGEEIKVRLIGVDCPELDEFYGRKASVTANIYTDGKTISLTYGQTRKDKYDRKLAYVNVLVEGWLNEMLIENGCGRVLSEYPFPYMIRYKRLEAMAKLNKYGIWAEKQEQKD